MISKGNEGGCVSPEMKQADQWLVWKKEKRNGKATKVPYQLNGKKASSTDPDHWCSFEDALGEYRLREGEYAGIGFVFSESDNWVGIDLDNCIDDQSQLTDWARGIVDWLSGYGYIEISPSGKGIKIFTRGNLPEGSRNRWPMPNGGQVEIYSQGRYFTVTGKVFENNVEIGDGQDGINHVLSLCPQEKKPAANLTKHQPSNTFAPDQVIAKCEQAANSGKFCKLFYRADTSGHSSGSEADLALGSIVAFYTQVFSVWLQVMHQSALWDEKWEREDYQKSTFDQAIKQDAFYTPPVATVFDEPSDDDLPPVEHKPDLEPPDEIMNLPGLMGLIQRHSVKTNFAPFELGAAAGAIALMSTLVAQKVRINNRGKTSPNIYVCSLAPSGAGKNRPRTLNVEILSAIGADEKLGPEGVTGDSAIFRHLESVCSAPLYQFDECKDWFVGANASKDTHRRTSAKAFKELTGASNQKNWQPKRWAGDSSIVGNQIEIFMPSPTLFLTGPPTTISSLSIDDAEDGFAGRILILPVDKAPLLYEEEEAAVDLPDEIIAGAKAWYELRPSGGNLEDVHPSPVLVPLSQDARQLAKESRQRINSMSRDGWKTGVWSRSLELEAKLALIIACSRFDPSDGLHDFEITGSDFQLAQDIVTWSTAVKIWKIENSLAENATHELLLKVKNAIETAAPKGCTKSQINRATRGANTWQRDDVLKSMLEAGDITQQTVSTGGRPCSRYFIRDGKKPAQKG